MHEGKDFPLTDNDLTARQQAAKGEAVVTDSDELYDRSEAGRQQRLGKKPF